MNTALRDVLHHAIERQAEAAPPPTGLVDAVFRRRRKQGRVRMAAAVVLAAAVAVPVVAQVHRRADPTLAPWRGHHMVLDALSTLWADHQAGETDPEPLTSLLLNRRTGQYEKVPYTHVVPSPDGRWAVVSTYRTNGLVSHRLESERIGVLDRASGQVRWLDRGARTFVRPQHASWAGDSSRFVLTEWPIVSGNFQPPLAALVDPATLAVQEIAPPTADSRMSAVEDGAFVLGPNSDRLYASRVGGLAGLVEWDLTGRELRAIGAHEGTWSVTESFSPGGDRIAFANRAVPDVDFDSRRSAIVVDIVDMATGQRTVRIRMPFGVYQVLGWYDANHLVVVKNTAEWSGEPTHLVLEVVRIADGRVVHTVDVPDDRRWGDLYLTPAAGLSGEAKKLAF